MRVQLVSDVHLGYGAAFDVLKPAVDVFVIAGDFAGSPGIAKQYFEKFCEKSEIPVVYVLGNHEYYDLRLDTAVDSYKKALQSFPSVHVLEKEVLTLDNVNFLGTTLWSDLSDPLAAVSVQRGLSDYIFIVNEYGHYVKAADTHREYKKSRAWLTRELSKRKNEVNVVVTHHAPSWECRDKRWDHQGANSQRITHGFCSSLDKLCYENSISHWLYGHTHHSKKLKIGETVVVSNQVGFEHEKRTSGFNRNQVLEIG